MNLRLSTYLLCSALALGSCASIGKPSVTPEAPTVTGVNAKGLKLGMQLKVDNPNPFPLIAESVTGTLLLDGKKLGTATATLDDSIASKGSATVDSKLEIAWTSASALASFIGKSSVPFIFDGKLKVGGGPISMTVNFKLKGSLKREQLAAVGAASLTGLFGK